MRATRITVLIVLLIFMESSGSDICFPYPENHEIKLYGSQESDSVEITIRQGENDCLWYDFEITEETSLRFEVMILEYPDCPPDFDEEKMVPDKRYWVDKKDCAVFSRPTDFDSSGGYFYLYAEPDSDNRMRIYESEVMNQIFRPLSFDREYSEWLNVTIATANGVFSGWVKRWCPTIYNSCN